MNNPFSLYGKTILITGASSGLGACASELCSKVGGTMIISGRNENRLAQTFSKLEGVNHVMHTADLCNEGDISTLVDKLPKLDGIVLCAGLTHTQPVKNITKDAVSEIFNTNLLSSIQMIKELLKKKKINTGGSIVFISSISASYADVGNSVYAATKGGVISFSRVLALELAARKITCNCIAPGFVPSNFLNAGRITEEQLEEERKKYPLGFGEPKDIANGIIYLLSDASKWVTGTVLTIDGGVTLK